MILHTFRVAFRAVLRRKATAAINLTGLALASGVALLFGLASVGLARYDAQFADADQVYQVYQDVVTPDNTRRVSSTWTPLLGVLQAELPGIAAGTRMGTFEALVGTDTRATVEHVAFADSGFFAVFPFAFAAGDPASALEGSDGAVISLDALARFFGDMAPADVIGKTLQIDESSEVVVMGVADVPKNMSVSFDLLVSWDHVARSVPGVSASFGSWHDSSHRTYVRLRPGIDADALTAELAPILSRVREGDDRAGFHSMRAAIAEPNDFPLYTTILALVALGVLAVASINATNLATARSLDRAGEIGVRKMLGAGRTEVAASYVAETALVALPAVAIGLLLASSALPWFNGVLDGVLTLTFDLGDPLMWAGLIALAALITLVAGSWPALVLSRTRPLESLSGRKGTRLGGSRLRGALIVGQFALTTFLLASAFTIHRQVDFLRGLDFDFGPTPIAVTSLQEQTFADKSEALIATQRMRDQLERDPAVASVTMSSSVPGDCCSSSSLRPAESGRLIDAGANLVEPSYFATYSILTDPPIGLEPSVSRRVVVNQAYVDAAGWTDPVGQTLYSSNTDWMVAAVTPDLAYLRASTSTGPFVHFIADTLTYGTLSVRAAHTDPTGALTALATAWHDVGIERDLTTEWADERYDATYVAENALNGLIGYAAGLAALVALIGLVGLATLIAAQRTKEIGVRKVLGASVGQIAVLLTRGPAGYVLLAVALAIGPVVWAMRMWLGQYPYQVSLSAGPLLLVGLGVLVVTIVVVGMQAIRAASAAPVDVLRAE